MIKFVGKYTTAYVMIDEIDETCAAQIVEMVNHPAFTNAIIIMPDTHAGAGGVIGFTMLLGDKIIPNTVGRDIGCSMLSAELYAFSFSEEEIIQLDIAIRKRVPFGTNVLKKTSYSMEKDFPWHKVSIENNLFCSSFKDMFGTEMERTIYSYKWFEEKCKQIGMSLKRAIHSIGTLGGGKWLPPAQEYNLNILKPFLIGLELRKYRKTGRKGNASVRD